MSLATNNKTDTPLRDRLHALAEHFRELAADAQRRQTVFDAAALRYAAECVEWLLAAGDEGRAW